jgi:signal transduction histidine kinase
LRPGVLDSLGLIPALEWQAAEFQKRTGVPCEFKGNVEQVDWGPDRSTALFRIVQETLTNVARHAQATAVSVSLEDHDGTVTLVVRDNGVGIADLAAAARKSTGVLGMRERALLVNGTIDIASQPGRGTTVTVKIPRGAAAAQPI